MPVPHQPFLNLENAISTLTKYGIEFKFPTQDFNKELTIKKSVAGNIFRAFKNLNAKPSDIYREWASKNFENIIIDFKKINSHEDYNKFLQNYCDSLLQRWDEVTLESNRFLMYGQAMKMINLLIKQIQESTRFRQIDKIGFQHVPLDSFALIPIRLIINDLTDLSYKILIPPSAAMGFVNTPQLYKILMDSIMKLSKLSKIPPIVYDYWSWDERHKNN